MKKILGFLLPIVGIFLLFKYLGKQEGPIRERVIEKKEEGSSKRKVVQSLPKAVAQDLNNRQKEILKLFNKREVLLPTDIYSVAPNVSTRTLRRDMDKLEELGFVLKEGSTKDTKYILKK
jgi:Fic family protein